MRFLHYSCCAFITLALLLSFPAVANTPTTETVPETTLQECRLDVWPSEKVHTSYTGWFHDGYIDGDIRHKKGYPNLYSETLETSHQVELLKALPWQDLLHRKILKLNVHDSARSAKTDSVASITPTDKCRIELDIHEVFIDSYTFTTRSVRGVYNLTLVETDKPTPVHYTTLSEYPINMPDKKSENFMQAVRVAMSDSYQKSVSHLFELYDRYQAKLVKKTKK